MRLARFVLAMVLVAATQPISGSWAMAGDCQGAAMDAPCEMAAPGPSGGSVDDSPRMPCPLCTLCDPTLLLPSITPRAAASPLQSPGNRTPWQVVAAGQLADAWRPPSA